MNKSDLIKGLAIKTGLSEKDAKEVVNETLNIIKTTLLEKGSGEVKLSEFGTFKTQTRAARVGRNPATGQPVEIPEKQVVKFKPYF